MKLEKLNLSEGKGKKWFLCGFIVAVVLMVVMNLFTSKAKYRITESIPLVRGKISYKPADLNIVAVYQQNDSGEYESIDTIPSSDYILNTTESYCEINKVKDTSIPMEYKDGKVYIGVSKKGTKCYLYFEKEILAKDTILENVTLATGTPDFSKTSCSSGCGEATVGLYTAEDDDGTSYYFRGDVENNYVSFAGFYWRIIRINGDGTIRMIYDGPTARANGTSSGDTQIGTSAFNPNGDNMYMGYMYTSGSVHGLGTNSTIKGVLDDWYKDNLEGYASYIDTNASFCGDRTAYTDQAGTIAGGGTGTTYTYYGAYIRLIINKIPSLKCSASSEDLYTVSGASKGNKALTYPIGLITADEVSYAGGLFNQTTTSPTNKSYYLCTSQDYWTMSPTHFSGGGGAVFYVGLSGDLGPSYAYSSDGVRPVINLKADTKFLSGNGTISAPYVVTE